MADDPDWPWPLLGGHLALDLANTVSWRLDPSRRQERLVSYERMLDWLGCATDSARVATLLSARPVTQEQEQALYAVRALRDALICLIDSHLAGEPSPEAARRHVQQAWQQGLATAVLEPGLPARWTVPLAGPGGVSAFLALEVGRLLQTEDQSRLRRCDGEGCGWLFLDGTRNRSRRWCDPDDCGNRTRVRNYVRRQR